VALTTSLNQDLSDYVGPDVEVVASPVNNAVAPATQLTNLTCLQLPTPDAPTRVGESGGHIQRGISRIFRARAYLDLLAFCRPSPLDYMRVISGTGRGLAGLWLSFSLHMSPISRCHPVVIRWERTGCLASRRSAPLMFGSALGLARLHYRLMGLNLVDCIGYCRTMDKGSIKEA
jgi:hypothetical protein